MTQRRAERFGWRVAIESFPHWTVQSQVITPGNLCSIVALMYARVPGTACQNLSHTETMRCDVLSRQRYMSRVSLGQLYLPNCHRALVNKYITPLRYIASPAHMAMYECTYPVLPARRYTSPNRESSHGET